MYKSIHILHASSSTSQHSKAKIPTRPSIHTLFHYLSVYHCTISEMSLFSFCRSASMVLRRSMFAFFSALKFFRASENVLGFCKLVKATMESLQRNKIFKAQAHSVKEKNQRQTNKQKFPTNTANSNTNEY